jgi:16S rRNA C1402 N4-methylase RsmH
VRRPIMADDAEVARNARARSARLRAVEKVA